jgi:threonine dehydratase
MRAAPEAGDVLVPTIREIEQTRRLLGERVIETPVHRWRGPEIAEAAGPGAEVFLKLELFQYTGTFKPRGALSNMLRLPREALVRGVTAVSAGNHAIAVAYAAAALGVSAKVVMMRGASPFRVERCRSYGADIVLAEDVHRAFDEAHRIEAEEGRTLVHPFEGRETALGTATLGLELCRQVEDLEAVIVPIGGGGLCAGVSTAVKQLQPRCRVYGVEPDGADTMHRSFASGKPEAIERVSTIADSLGAPHAAPYSFELCRRHVDALVRIDDDAMRDSMRLLFREMKLAVEPAGAAATAALCGPLRERLRGQRVGVVVCGTNIDPESFARHLREAPGARAS